MGSDEVISTLSCPHCRQQVAVDVTRWGETITCAHCGVPFEASPSLVKPRASNLRWFHFRCLRCGSVLEAREDQCNRTGRCPTCEGMFVVPAMDPRTGRAVGHADPGDDGENPTPVHAYAAAGHKAPRILREADDRLLIECPRCSARMEIRADVCQTCGLPFTMEGIHSRPTVEGEQGVGALVLGMLSLPMGICGGVGLVPGGLAIAAGIMGRRYRWGRQGVRAGDIGIVLGIVGCLISILVMASNW